MKKVIWRSYKFSNGNEIICRKMSATEKFCAERDNGKCVSITVLN